MLQSIQLQVSGEGSEREMKVEEDEIGVGELTRSSGWKQRRTL